MSKKIKSLFNQFLTEADEDVFRDREVARPPVDDFPSDQDEDFESGLDRDTPPSDFDTDGLGFDPDEVEQDNFAEVYDKVDVIANMIQELIDPKNEKNLSRLLAVYDRKDSIASGLAQKLERPILKASDSLAAVKNQLDQVASMEPALKRRLEALNGS